MSRPAAPGVRAPRLVKWYLDSVDPSGELVVCYVAELRVGLLRIPFSSVLVRSSGTGRVWSRRRFRSGRVDADAAGLTLAAASLGLHATWTAGTGTGWERVAGSAEGAVDWRCLSLASSAEVRVGARSHRGVGYAEVVSLSLPPWRLPLSDLVWGRFVADDCSGGVTWLDTGAFSAAWTPRGRVGVRLAEGAVTTADAGALTWDADVPIVERNVAASLLPDVLVRLLPRGVRGIAERKTLARGVWSDEGRRTEGWVVHERVTWE